MTKTIVTGASGLVGSHVLLHLILKKEPVVALKRESSNIDLVKKILLWYGVAEVDYERYIEWKNVDINDLEAIEDLITENSNVYHCVAQVSFHAEDRESMHLVNVEGTTNIVNACLFKNAQKLCYVSSVSTLSINKGEDFIHESSFWKNTGNETAYAQSKYLAEMEVWRGIEEGLNAVIVNPTVIIGPHDFTKGSSKMFETAANGLRFYTAGATGFVDVNDVAKVMIQLMNGKISAERFLLNGENITYKTFFETASKYLNQSAPSILVKPWLSGIAWRVAKLKAFITGTKALITKETTAAAMNIRKYDASKATKELQFKFNTIDDTIKKTCQFYQNPNSTIIN